MTLSMAKLDSIRKRNGEKITHFKKDWIIRMTVNFSSKEPLNCEDFIAQYFGHLQGPLVAFLGSIIIL